MPDVLLIPPIARAVILGRAEHIVSRAEGVEIDLFPGIAADVPLKEAGDEGQQAQAARAIDEAPAGKRRRRSRGRSGGGDGRGIRNGMCRAPALPACRQGGGL